VIDVGTQVAGRIDRFGLDPRCRGVLQSLVAIGLWPRMEAGTLLLAGLAPTKMIDYGSPVEQGTVLAQIDPALYLTAVAGARADLEKAEADLLLKQAKLQQAEPEWRRAQELSTRKAISQADYDLARANYHTALADIEVARAAIKKGRASAQEAEINLDYTTIRSPVKGVIVDRRVNVGQTVVASLNAPSLFLIAKDLKKLQVWASVNEADIGQIKPAQEVRFTVDAHPHEVFLGQVAQDQPRLNASMTQNVVTYTVVVNTDNSHLKLIPYLTANLQFVVSQKSSALLLSNAALRFRPVTHQVAPDAREEFIKSQRRRPGRDAEKETNQRTVWVVDQGYVRPMRITIGLSDGTMTEVLAGDLQEGAQVVFAEDNRQDSSGGNPFTVNMYGGKKPPP
jgi:HlyD family secretion protein